MKWAAVLAAVALLLAACSRREDQGSGDGTIVTADGLTRSYHTYVPESLSDDHALLIALHGGTGNGLQFARNSEFDLLAEDHGFTVVYPDGIEIRPGGSGRVWNGGYCCGRAVDEDIDDVGFISALIDELSARFSIDPNRVFVAGHSNGGIMAYRLACELSDKIAGIGVQAASLGIDDCAPESPVSVIHIHGTGDTNHPIRGGRGDGLSGVYFNAAYYGLEIFAAANGCREAVTESNLANTEVGTTTWAPCDAGSEVHLVEVQGASHAWMGHGGSAVAERLVGEPYMDLDASQVIWDFLADHPRNFG